MTTLIVALMNPAANGTVSFIGLWYNLLWVTIGNMIGGIFFVALPYWLGSKKKFSN